jgi:hypothetical protein
MRAFDHEAHRFHDAGHVSQLVLRLGPGFDPDAFRALLEDVARATPILRAPVGRRFGVAPPTFRLARAADAPLPCVAVHEGGTERPVELPLALRARLNARLVLEHGELLRCDVARYASGEADVVLTWAHLLLDGAGSELFVRRLDACFRGEAPPALDAPGAVSAAAQRSLAERGSMARRWQAHLTSFGAAPPRSLGGPRRRRAQALDYDMRTLTRDETAGVVARAASVAGALTPALFYLAATMRAHDAVFTARGDDPGHYVVPLPVNLRPRGAHGAVFQTNLALLWFHVARRHVVGELAGLVGELARQRRAGIRDGFLEASTAAMDFMRWAPASLHTWLARTSLGGEIASFYFAFTGEFIAGLTSFCGAEIVNGFHVPSVMPSPGSSIIMSVRDGRLNVAHIYQRDAVSADERRVLQRRLLDDLRGPRAGAADPTHRGGDEAARLRSSA